MLASAPWCPAVKSCSLWPLPTLVSNAGIPWEKEGNADIDLWIREYTHWSPGSIERSGFSHTWSLAIALKQFLKDRGGRCMYGWLRVTSWSHFLFKETYTPEELFFSIAFGSESIFLSIKQISVSPVLQHELSISFNTYNGFRCLWCQEASLSSYINNENKNEHKLLLKVTQSLSIINK